MDKIKCIQCGKEFEPEKRWGKYCGSKCRNAWHYKLTRDKRVAARAAQSAPAIEPVPAAIAEPAPLADPVDAERAALEEIVKGNGPGVIKDISAETGKLDI